MRALHAVGDFGGNHLLWRSSMLDPLEDAEKISDPLRPTHREFDPLVIADAIRGGYVTIGPSVIRHQLSVSRLEGSQIRIN